MSDRLKQLMDYYRRFGGERANLMIALFEAEIERLQREKAARVYYQDLVYYACNVLDRILGGVTVTGTLETPDGADFKQRCDGVAKKIERLLTIVQADDRYFHLRKSPLEGIQWQEHTERELEQRARAHRACDALCTWERSTGRETILILREMGGFAFRADNGKPLDSSLDDITDGQLIQGLRHRGEAVALKEM